MRHEPKCSTIAFAGLLVLAVSLFPPPASAARPAAEKASIKKLLADFTSPEWDKVSDAKNALESRQAEAIPALIELLDRDDKVELRNTADLIYPGAKEFYGHGGIVYYDIDWISARAGWVLEALTFQTFGFRESAIKESDLFKAAVAGQNQVQLKDPTKTEKARKQLRTEASVRAKAWWQKSKGSWNRFDAVVEALQSDDPVRQVWTFQWIRNGETPCDGLTMESFKKSILPEVQRLSKSGNEEVREEVKYLLEDEEGWWLTRKTQKKGSIPAR